ncbi:MAG TPA: 3-methyl-2-oxobutanoate hydroxymethyltransferase [Opitutaceae bacterium]|nr:3-methyl-2-oxobutanoate hydroxymethyltransferase [Opitutaceae bacterium]
MTPASFLSAGPRPASVPGLPGGFASVRDFARAKAAGRKIVMVSAYEAWSVRLLPAEAADCILVGDSAMMVVHGAADTLEATPELMALHTRSVARGAPGRLLVADMPFLSVRRGRAAALDCAAGLLRAGARAVKVEGVRGHGEVIRHLVESGIPVMGHLGLTPQSVHALGGYRVQGRDEASAARLEEDAAALEEAGAFALVLECVPAKLALAITARRGIPTVGIGAGAGCDGQVLVLHDLLGLNADFRPRFARAFADGAALVRDGAARFAAAVRGGEFPSDGEQF